MAPANYRTLALAVIDQAMRDVALTQAKDQNEAEEAAKFLTGSGAYQTSLTTWCLLANVQPAHVTRRAWAVHRRHLVRHLRRSA